MGGRPLDELQLVHRAKDGDVDAYAELVRMHQAAARRLAHAIAGAAIDADDIAQEAFVKAHAALPRFREGAPFRVWLLRIVANEARNRRRAAGRRTRYELRLVEDRSLGEAAPSPEAAVLASERRQTVLEAVTALPRRHRDVVACHYLLGLNEAETAAVLNIPLGTVKSRSSRAVARLRTALIGGDGA